MSRTYEWEESIFLFGRDVEQIVEYEIDPEGDICLIGVYLFCQTAKKGQIYYDGQGNPQVGPAFREQRFQLCWTTPEWRFDTMRAIRRHLDTMRAIHNHLEEEKVV